MDSRLTGSQKPIAKKAERPESIGLLRFRCFGSLFPHAHMGDAESWLLIGTRHHFTNQKTAKDLRPFLVGRGLFGRNVFKENSRSWFSLQQAGHLPDVPGTSAVPCCHLRCACRRCCSQRSVLPAGSVLQSQPQPCSAELHPPDPHRRPG